MILNHKTHNIGLIFSRVLQWVICVALLGLGVGSVQAGDALWQNPVTGRVIALPDNISVKAEDGGIYIENIPENGSVTSIFLQGKAIKIYPSELKYPTDDSLLSYPIHKSERDFPDQSSFEMNVEGAIWNIVFYNSNDTTQYSSSLALLNMILPSLKPLDKNEHFRLILPWSDKTVDLGSRKLAEGKFQYIPLEGYVSRYALIEKRGDGVKTFEGDVFINLRDVTIAMRGTPFPWQDQKSKMQDLLAGFSQEGSDYEVKNISLGGKAVYEIRPKKHDVDFSILHIPAKNRLWSIIITDFGNPDSDREPLIKKDSYMAIVEQLIATIPDNPPDIETTYTNPQTKRQLKLPEGWGVLQEFKNGKPLSQVGVYQYGKTNATNFVLYDCSPLFRNDLTWDPNFVDSEKIVFGGREAVKQPNKNFIISAKDEDSACQLKIEGENPSSEVLKMAEEIFATGQR